MNFPDEPDLAGGSFNSTILEDAISQENVRHTIKWLLYEAWDSELVDNWLADHLGDHTYYDTYKVQMEDYADYSKWLDRLRAGHYFQKKG